MQQFEHTVTLLSPVLFHMATIVGVLLALLLVAQILRSPRTPAATIGWLVMIVLVPIIGIPLYLTFGERKIQADIGRKAKLDLPNPAQLHSNPLRVISQRHYPKPVSPWREMFEGLVLLGAYEL